MSQQPERDILRQLELRRKLDEVRRLRLSLEKTLNEIAMARKLLSEGNGESRRVYRRVGPLIVQVSLREALDYLEDVEVGIRAQLSSLEEEERRLSMEVPTSTS